LIEPSGRLPARRASRGLFCFRPARDGVFARSFYQRFETDQGLAIGFLPE
jgi:hypothetical protein